MTQNNFNLDLRQPSIIKAISTLKPDSDYTKEQKIEDRKPDCDALTKILGFEVSTKERDKAFKEFKRLEDEKAKKPLTIDSILKK